MRNIKLMEWRHEINPDLLKAKEDCLTAAEVVRMMPELGKAKEIFGVEPGKTFIVTVGDMSESEIAEKLDPASFPVTLSVIASKLAGNEDIGAAYAGAAARSQILKKDFFYRCPEWWNHWDNVVITKGLASSEMKLGFSPDGFIGLAQSDITEQGACEIASADITTHAIINNDSVRPIIVKAYEPKDFLKATMTPKSKMPERYELAWAGSVIGWEHIENITLVFYCPELLNSQIDVSGEGDIYSPLPVMSFEFTLKDLGRDSLMMLDTCSLLTCVAEVAARKGTELSRTAGALFNSPFNQNKWATIEEIHDKWEQE